jgi:hypothetical protein
MTLPRTGADRVRRDAAIEHPCRLPWSTTISADCNGSEALATRQHGPDDPSQLVRQGDDHRILVRPF